jgi:hypothetical protein
MAKNPRRAAISTLYFATSKMYNHHQQDAVVHVVHRQTLNMQMNAMLYGGVKQ